MNTSPDEQIDTIDALAECRILRGSPENYRTSIEYKALAFRRDRNLASMTYEIKRARATFDPNLAGGNGGWRCPVGTRYGGQITDRFGRGCGWGVARRLANTITDTGERLEGALDRRRSRRVERRNQRVARRLGKPAERIARRASNGVDNLTQRNRTVTPRTRRGEGAPERMDRVANEVLQGNFLENRRARRAARRAQEQAIRAERPRGRRERRGAGIPERMEQAARDVLEGQFLERRRKRRETNRRRRERARIERTTPSGGNARPDGPTVPKGTVVRPNRRRGPRVDVGEKGSERRNRARDFLKDQKTDVNDYWRGRLGGREVNAENIRAYVAERENRKNVSPAYLNTLRARERDHEILNGNHPDRRVDELSPTVRKRLKDHLDSKPKAKVPANEPTPDAPSPKTPTPETPRPETPTPKTPTPETTRPEKPLEERRVNRRVVRLEDLSDDPKERRRIQKNVQNTVEGDRSNYKRSRAVYIENDNTEELQHEMRVLQQRHDGFVRMADDKSKPAVERYQAHEMARMLQNEKMKHQEAYDKLLARRRAAREAAAAAEAPSGPPTPRTPESGRRVNTFGLDKARRAELDRFAESDRVARRNQLLKIDRLNNENNDRVDDLIARNLADADEMLADYKRDLANDKADASDRYIAQQSIESLTAHRDALRAYRDGRKQRNAPAAPAQPQEPAQPEGPQLLVPDEAKQKELRQKFKERADAILKKRQKVIGDYMKKRYGSGDAPWKDREKNPNIAGLSSLLDDANGRDPDKKAAAIAKLTEWAKGIYELPEFEGKDGTKFKTSVQIGIRTDGLTIDGSIQAQSAGSQVWRNIGEISRRLYIRKLDRDGNPVADFKPFVSNGLLKMRGNKNSGFASIYNPHAFTWLKAAGFDHAKVGTAWDGKFVWGKMGYRESSGASRSLANKLEAEIKKIREGGRSSVVNKRDAEVIAALIDEARRRNFDVKAPQHAEYIMAMSNRDTARVKSWFTRNAPFNHGQFFFDEIADDPRS